MSRIEVYSFEGVDGAEDGFTTQDQREAEARARQYGLRVVANTYQ